MSEATNLHAVKSVIRIIRNQRVILDSDLAKLYGVTTKRLNEAVKRNLKRFPSDFMFQLDVHESTHLRSQIATLENQNVEDQGVTSNRSQIATGSSKHRNTIHLPFAFTEHGIIMAASVLNSDLAIEMSVFIARTFVRMREQLMASTANAKRLAEIEKTLLTHDSAIVDLYEQIHPLLLPPPAPATKRIGFGVKEKRASYRIRRSSPKTGAIQ
jgi:hypothetical protein